MHQQADLMSGGAIVAITLHAMGASRVFALSGNQIMPIFKALDDLCIEVIHTRHEASAVYMAEAHAQLTGEVGVALVTAGAGLGNAVGALISATQSQTPVLLISGDSPVSLDSRGAFQELDQVSITRPVTKHSERVMHTEKIQRALYGGAETAKAAQPGPVHIALPFDILEAKTGYFPSDAAQERATTETPVPAHITDKILNALGEAERPIIVLGPSLNNTRLPGIGKAINKSLGVPVVEGESPRGMRDPALGNFQHVSKRADLVMAFGKSVDFSLGIDSGNFWNSECKWLQINASLDEQNRARQNLRKFETSLLVADPIAVIKALAQTTSDQRHREDWCDEVEAAIARRLQLLKDRQVSPIHPYDLCKIVQEQICLSQNNVVIMDGGEFGQWARAYVSGAECIVNGLAGAIGAGLSHAIAASKARPNSRIIAMMGDGSLGFYFSEFETAVRNNAPFVAVIGNDQCWNAERQILRNSFNDESAANLKLSEARYDLAVEAMGGHGEYVTKLAELRPALTRAFESKKPACVNVLIEGLPSPSAMS